MSRAVLTNGIVWRLRTSGLSIVHLMFKIIAGIANLPSNTDASKDVKTQRFFRIGNFSFTALLAVIVTGCAAKCLRFCGKFRAHLLNTDDTFKSEEMLLQFGKFHPGATSTPTACSSICSLFQATTKTISSQQFRYVPFYLLK